MPKIDARQEISPGPRGRGCDLKDPRLNATAVYGMLPPRPASLAFRGHVGAIMDAKMPYSGRKAAGQAQRGNSDTRFWVL